MRPLLSRDQRKRLLGVGIMFAVVLFGGSAGYRFFSHGEASWLDCLYMTVITVTTIGYGEVFDLTGNPSARIFTMAIAFTGIGSLTYLLSNITAFIVEGTLRENYRRRRMEKKAAELNNHYIVCGFGALGSHIVTELQATKRPCIVVTNEEQSVEKLQESFPDVIYLEADPTSGDALTAAGIERAAGLFAATDDDNLSLVISLTARQLNPDLKIIARCHDTRNISKIKAAGATAVISPTYIGGLRMTSEMVRPAVVSFLDVMLRQKDRQMRVEEITIRKSGLAIADLGLDRYPQTLVLAVRTGEDWIYNPARSHALSEGSTLVLMTTPEERNALDQSV